MSAGTFTVANHTLLNDFCLIQIEGPDRYDFLQGQLTQDLAVLRERKTALTGWATAKGRLLLAGQLFDWRDAVLIMVPASTAGQLSARLEMFTLRASVNIVVTDLCIAGLSNHEVDVPVQIGGLVLDSSAAVCAANDDLLVSQVAADPSRLLVIGAHQAVEAALEHAAGARSSAAHWNLANIRHGIPVILPETTEMFVPQMTNLDLLDGISFTKGCYVGQEIVARTANLGRIKRRMFRYRCEPVAELTAGAPIHSPEGPAGVVVTAAGTNDSLEFLAVTQLRLAHTPLYADPACKHPLTQCPLPYQIPC